MICCWAPVFSAMCIQSETPLFKCHFPFLILVVRRRLYGDIKRSQVQLSALIRSGAQQCIAVDGASDAEATVGVRILARTPTGRNDHQLLNVPFWTAASGSTESYIINKCPCYHIFVFKSPSLRFAAVYQQILTGSLPGNDGLVLLYHTMV